MTLRRFFLPPEMVHRPRPEIVGSDAQHICRVLRLGAGDTVELFDGSGNGYRARIVSACPERVRLSIEDRYPQLTESPLRLTVAQGVLKERKMDDLVRHLTELGVDCWMPFFASRSIPVPGGKGWRHRLERWRKIAREAVKQCRRGRVPEIVAVENFEAVLAQSKENDLSLLFWEGAAGAFDIRQSDRPRPERILLAVGPEGGFAPDEVDRAMGRGFLATGLGPRILRAETAALAACTLVQYRFGDMGPAPGSAPPHGKEPPQASLRP